MKHEVLAMSPRRQLRLLTSVAVVALAPAFIAASAYAQEAPPPPPPQAAQAPQSMETIEVTGSRILNTDAASANPITVVGAAQIEKQKSDTVEDLLLKLPSVDATGGVTAATNNGGGGASELGLRNLGPERTLILVNGERYPFTDLGGTADAVDLNNIPVSMIDHIDILRDGASSIYGADAIGGVVNIVTKQHFQGVEVGGGVGASPRGDSLQYNVYSTLGSDFDAGNILINASDSHEAPVIGADRYWAVNQYNNADINYFDSISSRVTGTVGQITLTPAAAAKAGTSAINYYFPHGLGSAIPAADAYTLGTNQLGEGITSGGGLTPGDVAIPGAGVYFDYLPTQGLLRGLDTQQVNFTANYDILPSVTATLEAFYTDRQSSELLNPEPTGSNTPTPQFPNGLYISPTYVNSAGQTVANPYNPTNNAAFDAATGAVPGSIVPLLTRRFENGPRFYSDDVNTYRIRAGLQGTIFDDYNWQVGYIDGSSQAVFRVANETNFYHLSQELGMNPCGTQVGCSVGNFLGYNTLTPAQAQYLAFENIENTGYNQQIAYGNVDGPVATLPAGDVKAAIGFEYRTDNLFDYPNSVVSAGDGAVFSTPSQGGYATGSGYIEVNAPLLKDLPFVKILSLDASGRYDYNTTFGRSLTHKEGLDWAIDDDFRLRGSHSTGFRAPQVKELYAGHALSSPSGTDPCAAGGAGQGNAACTASIVAVGLPANTVPGTINQLDALVGGNPDLKPETSQAFSMGGVYTPTYVPGLSVAVDYYTILIRDEISTLDPNLILADCFLNQPYVISQASACALIGPRNKLTGALGQISALNGNVSNENTDGIDIDASYVFDLADFDLADVGKVAIDGQASYLLSDNAIGVGGTVVQQAGTYGATGSAEPRWKALLSGTFSSVDGWNFNWTERYYGGVKNADESTYCEYGSISPCNTVGQGDYMGNEAAGVFYSDISATYKYNNVKLTVGVDNLFDKDPPFLFPNDQGTSIGEAGYDFYGRMIYMKASINFGAPGAPSPAPMAAPAPPPPAPAPAPAPAMEKQREFQVFFDFDKSNITDAAARVIQAAADVVKSGGIAHITVTGHTDTVGTAKYNQSLSERRAASVKSALVADGVDGGEISTIGVGKNGLLVPTKDGVREPQNRRAVIELQ